MDEFFNLFWQSVTLTIASMKARYRKTFAGFFWVIMNPLFMYGIQAYIFENILKTQINNYTTFLLGGLLPWIFISQSLDMATPIFVNSSSLLKSFQIFPIVLLISQVCDNAINFLSAFVFVLLVSSFSSWHFEKGILLLPLPLLLLFVGTFSIAWILATLNVFFRDTRFLISIALNILFFLTPIFYSEALAPAGMRWLFHINPLYYFILPIRNAIYHYELFSFLTSCGKSSIVAIISFVIAQFIWNKLRNELYFRL